MYALNEFENVKDKSEKGLILKYNLWYYSRNVCLPDILEYILCNLRYGFFEKRSIWNISQG